MAESGNLRSLVAREVYIDSTIKTGTIDVAPGRLDSLPVLRSGDSARNPSLSLSARANKKEILGRGRKKVGKLPYFLQLYGFSATPEAGSCLKLGGA